MRVDAAFWESGRMLFPFAPAPFPPHPRGSAAVRREASVKAVFVDLTPYASRLTAGEPVT